MENKGYADLGGKQGVLWGMWKWWIPKIDLDTKKTTLTWKHRNHVRKLIYRTWPIGGFHVAQVSFIVTQVRNKITYHLRNWVKKLKYRRGVIKNVPRFRECVIFRTRVIWQKVSLKIIVFIMETPWRPETSGNIWSSICLSQNVHSLC